MIIFFFIFLPLFFSEKPRLGPVNQSRGFFVFMGARLSDAAPSANGNLISRGSMSVFAAAAKSAARSNQWPGSAPFSW